MEDFKEFYKNVVLEEENKEVFQQLMDEVLARRSDFSEQSFVPGDIVELMKKSGFFRAAVPKRFGGNARNPISFLKAVEKLGSVDGSTAWVASFGSSNYYLAALPPETQEKIYSTDPDQMFAGGLFPVQPAVQEGSGWIVNGRWKFSSGCKTADWIGVGIGGGKGGFNDKPRTAVFPAAMVDVVDNWNVVGMEGTGSHDLSVTNQFVDESWTFIRGANATIDEPLYRIPTVAFSSQVHTVVSMGLAVAAFTEILNICESQATTTGAPKLADRAYFRIELSKAVAAFLGARSYFYDIVELVWDRVSTTGYIDDKLTNQIRLSAAHASHVSARAVERCYSLAGINAIFLANRMQKIYRDSMVINQHAHLNESVYDGAGAVLSNVEPFRGYL